MARPCSVCIHPEVEKINQLLLQNKETYVSLGTIFSLSPAMLRRHHKKHLTSQMLRSARVGEVVNSNVLLDQVQELQRRAIKILDKAEKQGDLRGGTMAIREATRTLTLQARLLGELVAQAQVNVLVVTPEWHAARARILQALQPYPEAKRAVLAAIGTHTEEEQVEALKPLPARSTRPASGQIIDGYEVER
jgi:hypothetical protein